MGKKNDPATRYQQYQSIKARALNDQLNQQYNQLQNQQNMASHSATQAQLLQMLQQQLQRPKPAGGNVNMFQKGDLVQNRYNGANV